MAGNKNDSLTVSDLKELESFSNLVISRLDELRSEGNRVKNMGSPGHWCDAKVPDSEWGWFNFVSLKTKTDKNLMTKTIEVYKNFYQELKIAVDALRQAARDGSADADEIISLYGKLTEMLEKAERGKDTTNSSTLYEIHEDFIARKQPLENRIKGVECVALRQQLRQVTRAWKEANAQISEMRQEMQGVREDNEEIQRRLNDVIATNEQMAETQRQLLRENETMARNQRILMEQNETMVQLLQNFIGNVTR